ncbi:hypothetical protein ACHQM5_026746 [Ranunculus cassubicifolius]
MFKKLSGKNCENRGKLAVNHRGGSKAFVRYREEHVLDAETNQECGRIELYRLTNFSESKGWISPIAAKHYEDMLALKAQPVPEGSTETEDDICEVVLGKRSRYKRGLGNGILPPSFSTTTCHYPEIEKLRRKAEDADIQ